MEPSPSPSFVPPLSIVSVAFHAGELGFGYAPVTPAVKGGVPPYAWTISGGSFPNGLVMSPDGAVSGTPSVTGTFVFSLKVTDSANASAMISTSIAISKHIAVVGICTTAQPCLVEAGCVTACGVFGNQSGGVAPFTYKVVAGVLPAGMSLSGFSVTKAFPSPAKDWIFTVMVTDAIGATAKTTAKFHVFPHIAFSGQLTASCNGYWISGCTMSPQLQYTLGTPNLAQPKVKTTLVSGPALPGGSTFTARSGIVTGLIPQQTCPSSGYDAVVRLVLVDGSICSQGTFCASAPATVTIHLLSC